MKKFIANTFLFLLFAAGFYLTALMLWGGLVPNSWKKNLNYRRGASGFTYTRLQEVQHAGKVDVLFVGSSHAYRGFDPRIFKKNGYTSFNLGSSSQTPLQTELLLTKYLDRLAPSTLIFEVYPYTFSSDGVESSLDVIANDSIDAASVSMAMTVNNVKTYNTLVYGFIKRLIYKEKPLQENVSLTEKNGSIINYTSYISGGFMERRVEKTEIDTHAGNAAIQEETKKAMQSDVDVVQTKEGKWNPRQYQLLAFERIVKKLKEKNIRVMIVQAPVYKNYYAMLKCNTEIDDYFSSKGEYYNFNKLMDFDPSFDFADYHHLNQTGVEKMNKALIEKAFTKK